MTLQKFSWSNTTTWPDFDGPGYVFLGRAVLRLGKHMFPAEWSHRDTFVLPQALPATADEAGGGSLFLAWRLLGDFYPEVKIPAMNMMDREASRVHFTSEIWAKALDAATRQAAVAKEGQERFRAVKRAIQEHCAYGRLVSAQLGERGDYYDLKAHIWNTPKNEGWFEQCRISDADAYGSSSHGASSRYSWLFIGEDGLSGLIDPLAGSPSAAEASKGHRSKYLVFLLAAADELNVSPGDTRGVKVIAREVEAFARKSGLTREHISPSMAEKMATILREPEAGGGKNPSRFWPK